MDTIMIRVGRITYTKGKMTGIPSLPKFETIMVMMKSHSKWYPLSPYILQEDGQIMENTWQFSKVYSGVVAQSVQKVSRYDPTVAFEFKKHTQIKTTPLGTPVQHELTPEYLEWREKGMKARYPVRYPVGFHGRGKCVYALENVDTDALVPLDYVQSRKAIYEPLYTRLARKCPKYQVLLSKLKKGENLLIIEVDGPHQESMPYYKQKYGVADDFITDHTMLVTPENIDIVLNDTKHPYGHGYCLSHALYQDI